ncbi:hypothetical protein PSACC_03563 [Paramicrosporidium saccamoebae]|uniref:Uncharacterized protein n=1 Tax=Paramicrosporidium saccamoebae TaxID=1246581 RepID=A0A2H9TFU7_9FUNG|nr:hypothetical protein PSACC_03563 [Paramicrosporidium saccamoebae]
MWLMGPAAGLSLSEMWFPIILFFLGITTCITVEFTPETLLQQSTLEQVNCLLTAVSFDNSNNVRTFLGLLECPIHNFKKLYYNHIRESTRLGALKELARDPKMHDLLFQADKLVTCPELACWIFLVLKIEYDGRLLVNSGGDTYAAVGTFMKYPNLLEAVIQEATKKLHEMTSLNWLREYLRVASTEDSLNLLDILEDHMTPQILAIYFESFPGQTAFLDVYLTNTMTDDADKVIRLLIAHAAKYWAYIEFTEEQLEVINNVWTIAVSGDNRAFQGFIEQYLEKTEASGNLFFEVVERLTAASRQLDTRPSWGLLGSLLLMCNSHPYIPQKDCKRLTVDYINEMTPSRTTPLMTRLISTIYPLKYPTPPVAYWSAKMLPPEEARLLWLRSDTLHIAAKGFRANRSISDLAWYLRDFRQFPWNARLKGAPVVKVIRTEAKSAIFHLYRCNIDHRIKATDGGNAYLLVRTLLMALPYAVARGEFLDISVLTSKGTEHSWIRLCDQLSYELEEEKLDPYVKLRDILHHMQVLLLTVLVTTVAGLWVSFTLNNLHRYGSRQTVVALMSIFSLGRRNIDIICQMLASREYDLHTIYDEITESSNRADLLSSLYEDQNLHDLLFNARKLIHNHRLAYLVLLRTPTRYKGNLVSDASTTAINIAQLYGFPLLLKARLIYIAVNAQMGNVETLEWLAEYLAGSSIKEARGVMNLLSPQEMTPHVLQVFLDRLNEDAIFLQTFLHDDDAMVMDLLRRLMVLCVAVRLRNKDLSPQQQLVGMERWKRIRGMRLFYKKKEISGESLYSFAMNQMESDDGKLRERAMDALSYWGLSTRDRSYWGMLTGLMELGEGDVAWFFRTVRRESVAPMTFLSLCRQFITICLEHLPRFKDWPDEYFFYELLPLNVVVQEWMRGGQFTLLQADEMHYSTLIEAEGEILEYSKLPWNGHVGEGRVTTWIGDALIAKLQRILSGSIYTSGSFVTCMALTIPYLIACKKKLDFSRAFQDLSPNATWKQLYHYLDRNFPSKRKLASFIAQMEDLTEYFTFTSVRILIDSSYYYHAIP